MGRRLRCAATTVDMLDEAPASHRSSRFSRAVLSPSACRQLLRPSAPHRFRGAASNTSAGRRARPWIASAQPALDAHLPRGIGAQAGTSPRRPAGLRGPQLGHAAVGRGDHRMLHLHRLEQQQLVALPDGS
jgi:hypothetical protein